MKKIGFIDYFIDEWHANNYPAWIRESKFKEKFDVCHAWAQIDKEGGMTTEEWCRKNNVERIGTIEELVKKSDCLVVLSPDNPEKHEELCRLALMSGKPVFIDKTFSPGATAAARMFQLAEKHGTPVFSSSALRFSKELQNLAEKGIEKNKISLVSAHGPGKNYENYSVHQLEMIVSLLGTGAKRIMQCGTEHSPFFIIDYADGRRGMFNIARSSPFQILIQCSDGGGITLQNLTDSFPLFIESMLSFFETAISPVPAQETIEIMALIEAGNKAIQSSDIWVDVNM